MLRQQKQWWLEIEVKESEDGRESKIGKESIKGRDIVNVVKIDGSRDSKSDKES